MYDSPINWLRKVEIITKKLHEIRTFRLLNLRVGGGGVVNTQTDNVRHV